MINKMIKKAITINIYIIFICTFNIATAQIGPGIPSCPTCEEGARLTTPLDGTWYNPEQSGVGLSFETQGNDQTKTLFGIYYGYNETGQAVWYTFQGILIQSDDPGIMWTLEAQLSEFKNGSCIDCDYQAPVNTDFMAHINLTFNQKNHASFSINNGQKQFIVPLVFGVQSTQEFQQQTTYQFPDLTGRWIYIQAQGGVSFDNITFSKVYNLTRESDIFYADGTKKIQYIASVFRESSVENHLGLTCRTYLDENNHITGPVCAIFADIDENGLSDGDIFSIGGVNSKFIYSPGSGSDNITNINGSSALIKLDDGL
jgi:hypothetical protein